MHYFPGKFFLLCLLATLASLPALAQNDLPGPVANNQLIKNGSYIIAMDTNYQKHPYPPFNQHIQTIKFIEFGI